MKEVTINGVSYLPASVLAREFRYTTDYIGQLCRAKKVDAQLVGRSWYVNPLSLTTHKSTKYTKNTVAEKTIVDTHKVEISRIDVESTLAKNTVKAVQAKPQNFETRIEWKPAKYVEDDGDLIPQVKREIVPTRVHVELADATPVSIKTSAKTIDMVAEELPSVSLKGKLNISSLEEDFEELTEEIMKREVPLGSESQPKSIQNSLTKPAHRSENKRSNAHVQRTETKVAKITLKAQPEVVPVHNVSVGLPTTSFLLVAGSLTAVLFMVLFFESHVRADALSLESGLQFSTTSYTALVSHFLR